MYRFHYASKSGRCNEPRESTSNVDNIMSYHCGHPQSTNSLGTHRRKSIFLGSLWLYRRCQILSKLDRRLSPSQRTRKTTFPTEHGLPPTPMPTRPRTMGHRL